MGTPPLPSAPAFSRLSFPVAFDHWSGLVSVGLSRAARLPDRVTHRLLQARKLCRFAVNTFSLCSAWFPYASLWPPWWPSTRVRARPTLLPPRPTYPTSRSRRSSAIPSPTPFPSPDSSIPTRRSSCTPRSPGYIRKINVDIGDRVQTGQVLAVLEVPELVAQLQGAEAAVRSRQEEISRAQNEVSRAEANHAALHANSVAAGNSRSRRVPG